MSKYIGYKGISNGGCSFVVISKGSKNGYYVVRFEGGYEAEVYYGNIKAGKVKNPYHPSVYSAGYFGVGKFVSRIGNKMTKEYMVWSDVIGRCFDRRCQEKHPTYTGCSVAPEWLNFQNFAAWITSHPNWNKGYALDKDLKIMGNKVYSKETCELVPQAVNNLLIRCGSAKGNHAIGVSWDKRSEKYRSTFYLTNEFGLSKQKDLGLFNTEAEAFFAYKKAKEENVKRVANLYKDEICIEIYNNLMNYEVPVPEFREVNNAN